jgi:hypothetical protein
MGGKGHKEYTLKHSTIAMDCEKTMVKLNLVLMKCMQTLCNAESPMQQDDAVLPKKMSLLTVNKARSA